MEVIQDVTTCQCAYPNLVLTIGSFDGLHLGHQRILDTVIARARAAGGTAALMSLSPHPKAYFNPEEPAPLLTGPGEKEALLRDRGLDVYFILPFTRDVASMEAHQFLAEIVRAKCGATRVVVGHDFSFGAGARGNYAGLAEAGARLGFATEMVPPVLVDGERVSSTRIRELVAGGDLEQARRLLGRPYRVSGVVARGRGLGDALGYPTANFEPDGGILPALGIYAARVRLDEETYIGAVNIGFAPTLPHERPVVEVHLLDFEGELGGRQIEVELHYRLRGEKKFDSVAALQEAIRNDIVKIRQYFDCVRM